ncbi:MAG: hemerythrin domain-containing protein [candidate division KSB1 bacterium]
MKITEALLGEHGVFYAQFDHLEKVVPRMENLTLVQSQGALLASALAPHAHIENDLLFHALEAHLPSDSGPLAVMRMEHDEIEGTLQRLLEARDLGEAQNLIRHVIDTARGHFAKEEQILFVLATQMLGARALEQLGQRWAEARRVRA